MPAAPAPANGSPGGVLRLIRERRAVTRSDIMDVTGVSRSTGMPRRDCGRYPRGLLDAASA